MSLWTELPANPDSAGRLHDPLRCGIYMHPNGGFMWRCTHCAVCGEPAGPQGHYMGGRFVDGKFRKFADGKHRFACASDFETAEVVK